MLMRSWCVCVCVCVCVCGGEEYFQREDIGAKIWNLGKAVLRHGEKFRMAGWKLQW